MVGSGNSLFSSNPRRISWFAGLALLLGAAACVKPVREAQEPSSPTETAEPHEQAVPDESEELGETLPVDTSGTDGQAQCGGMAGMTCDAGLYCHFEPAQTCGAADQMGQCREAPQICTRQYLPVCGCDGKTYSTACTANAASVSVALVGECAKNAK